MRIIAVIPARYGSSRFPGKPLELIDGSPMIEWVYERVKKIKNIEEVYVATDDVRIENECTSRGINVIMTRNNHETSTSRVHEVSEQIDADLYLVINGDEPLIDPEVVSRIVPDEVPDENQPYVANLMTKIVNPVEAVDFTNIKVVTDKMGYAMYYSRSPIPYPKNSMIFDYYKHVGVLLYNKKALDFFVENTKGPYEIIEDDNELRFIENGVKIKMVEVESKTLSVDTPKDLEKIRSIVKENNIRCKI